jgi:methylated-DNA-[protein]-cysteine S-methyltransferase
MKGYYNSPIGCLEITGSEKGIISLYFLDEKKPSRKPKGVVGDCIEQLREYFAGSRQSFDLELDLQGTDFQLKVWNALMKIPFGKTISYLDLSKKLGNADAIRAVGNANGSNPVSIIVPCHRVIGSDGRLTGYGGGLPRKKWLLDFERSFFEQDLFGNKEVFGKKFDFSSSGIKDSKPKKRKEKE